MKSNFKNVGVNETINVVVDCFGEDETFKTSALLTRCNYNHHCKQIKSKNLTRFYITVNLSEVSAVYTLIKKY